MNFGSLDLNLGIVRAGGTVSPWPSGELVLNGGFDSIDPWLVGNMWAIAAGVATHTPGSGASDLDQAVALIVPGAVIQVQLTISGRSAGNLNVRTMTGSTNLVVFSKNRTLSGEYTADGDGFRLRATNGFNGSVDNVSAVRIG